mmetsp:Transcript_58513/g.174254  ORF Transcript_58513/g.174254 Transcript_58513/m.174254 type:complete len:99 (+) Transcript_58513:1032-1328(+)
MGPFNSENLINRAKSDVVTFQEWKKVLAKDLVVRYEPTKNWTPNKILPLPPLLPRPLPPHPPSTPSYRTATFWGTPAEPSRSTWFPRVPSNLVPKPKG